MKPDLAVQLLADVLWNAMLISAPLLLATLAIGLLISIMQAVTQIQEMSLSTIPKIVVAILVLVVAGPWMMKRLLAFSASLIGKIPSYF